MRCSYPSVIVHSKDEKPAFLHQVFQHKMLSDPSCMQSHAGDTMLKQSAQVAAQKIALTLIQHRMA